MGFMGYHLRKLTNKKKKHPHQTFCFEHINEFGRYLASRLVKSSDSHASDPCSRLGGSSWLCNGIISLQSSMKCQKFICGATLLSEGELESTWPCSIQNIAEFNEIENSSPYNGEDGAD